MKKKWIRPSILDLNRGSVESGANSGVTEFVKYAPFTMCSTASTKIYLASGTIFNSTAMAAGCS